MEKVGRSSSRRERRRNLPADDSTLADSRHNYATRTPDEQVDRLHKLWTEVLGDPFHPPRLHVNNTSGFLKDAFRIV